MRVQKTIALFAFLLLALLTLSVSAKEKAPASSTRQTSADNTSADSMDYDFKIEWKLFSTAEPVKAFVLTQNGVWYVTDAAVIFQNFSRSDSRKSYPAIGSLAQAADVTCIAADASGSAWVGTTAGIAREAGGNFTAFTTAEGLCDNEIKKIAVDKDGIVYASTGNGLCRFAKGKWGAFAMPGAKMAFDLAVDNNNTLWCATNNGILSYSNGKWQSFTTNNGMSYDDAHALAVDPKNGDVWAAVGEKDVNCYDAKAGKWKVYMDILDNIVAIMVDTQSRVWFGSSSSGLTKFNGDEWVNDPRKNGISAAQVNGLQRDSGGNLWFATDKGLLRMNNPYPY